MSNTFSGYFWEEDGVSISSSQDRVTTLDCLGREVKGVISFLRFGFYNFTKFNNSIKCKI